MKRLLLTSLILLSAAISGWTQQESPWSMTPQNRLLMNPAYAGSRGQLSVLTAGRRQWIGFEGAPNLESLSAHLPTSDGRNGFGFTFLRDRNAFTSRTSLAGSYALRIPAGGGHFSMGMRMGVQNYRLRTTEIDVWDPGDPSFESTMGDFNKWMMVAGPGLYFSHPNFYVGASIPDILPHKLYDTYYEPLVARSYWHHYLMGGAMLDLGSSVKFRPNVILRLVKGAPVSMDLNAGFWFFETISIGASWRPGQAYVFQSELYLLKGLRLGYSYDYPIGITKTISTGSHEVMLGFDLSLFTRGEVPAEAFIH